MGIIGAAPSPTALKEETADFHCCAENQHAIHMAIGAVTRITDCCSGGWNHAWPDENRGCALFFLPGND